MLPTSQSERTCSIFACASIRALKSSSLLLPGLTFSVAACELPDAAALAAGVAVALAAELEAEVEVPLVLAADTEDAVALAEGAVAEAEAALAALPLEDEPPHATSVSAKTAAKAKVRIDFFMRGILSRSYATRMQPSLYNNALQSSAYGRCVAHHPSAAILSEAKPSCQPSNASSTAFKHQFDSLQASIQRSLTVVSKPEFQIS